MSAREQTNPVSKALVPVERGTLQTQILAQLKERLITGRFKPGDRLTLRALAAQIGTSLMPVRDAVNHLQSIGVLDPQANHRSLAIPKISISQLQEISELRLTLETMAAERAAILAGSAGITRLWDRFDAIRICREEMDGADYLRAHWDFHLEIALLARNDALVSSLTSLWLRIGPTVQISGRMNGGKLEALTCHRNIVEAIVAGDSVAIHKAIEADIFYGFPRQDLPALANEC